MSRRTDDSENMEIRGMITILPDSFNGDGSLEVSGTVFADNVRSNTDLAGVQIEEILFKESSVNIKNEIIVPSLPVVDSHTFYIKDQLFQSIDSAGKTTIYQPSTTKGDIVSHDGTVQQRIVVGQNGNVLTADSSSSTGLSWKPSIARGTSSRLNLVNQDDVIVYDASFGNGMALISPCVPNAPGSSFIFSKSSENVGANITTIVQAQSSFGDRLVAKYSSFSSPEIRKDDNSRGNGDYTNIESNSYPKIQALLPGNASWVDLFPDLTGNFFLSVYSENNEEACSFLVSKSVASSNAAAISKIATSPSVSNTLNIQLRWQSSAPLQIRKATISANASPMIITNNLEYSYVEESVQLTGTASVNLKSYRIYEKKNMIVSVSSSVLADSPKTIYFLSKNLRNTGSAKFSVSSPGSGGIGVIVDWNVNSGVSIRKTGNAHDGVYIVRVVK
jgi:hypothetical protein